MSSDRKAKEIFLSAIEIEADIERDAFVRQACASDPGLREQVERLIQAHFDADSLLDQPGLADRVRRGDEPASAETLPPQAARSGVQIGPYKLLEQIGAGGMGVVYMAEQLKPIRRKVAIKIIKPGMDTAQVIARFEAERQALAMMDHPNIAHVLDAGTTEFHRPYFVMELVRGIPITEYCDNNKLTTRDRLKLFAIVCQAVQHAHTKGIIHRDLKPSNILVTLHDGTPVPKIIDFGVAKATNQQLTDRTLFTSIHQFVGTPLYMSPEQAELSGLDVDTRSDIYSLGVLLYELLTGTTPFDRLRLNEAALDEVRRIIREEEPQKPSTRVSSMGDVRTNVSASRGTDPAKLTQSLRRELDWIVMKTLEKDRTRRYETASSLAAEIHRYLEGEPVEACPPSTVYRIHKFVHKHRLPVSVAGAFACVIVASSMLAWWLYGSARRSRDHALLAQQQSVIERDRAVEAQQTAALNLEEATREKVRADQKSNELKQRLYNYNILKADSAYRDKQLDVVQRMLSDCVEEQRRWEWHFLQRLSGGRRTIPLPSEFVMEFALTRDGKHAVIMDSEGMTSLIRLSDGSSRWRSKTKIPVSWGVEISPDEKTVALCGRDNVDKESKDRPPTGTVQLLDMSNGKTLWEQSHRDCVQMFPTFNSDGTRILCTTAFPELKKSEIQLRDTMDGSVLFTHPAMLNAQAILDNTGDKIIITETMDQSLQGSSTIRCVAISDSSTLWSFSRPTETSTVVLSPDGNEVIGGGQNHALVLWDARTGEKKGQFKGPLADPSFFFRFSHDRRRLLSVSMTGHSVVWDWNSKQVIESLGKVSRDNFVSRLTPDGMHLAYADAESFTLNLRSVSPPAESLQLIGHRSGFKGATFADRETVVSAGTEGAVRIWNGLTGQELNTIPTGITCLEVAVTPDKSKIATATTSGVILWDRASGKAIHHWDKGQEVWFVKFAKDGKILAAAGKSGDVKLWSVDEGTELTSLKLNLGVHGFDITKDAEHVIAFTLPDRKIVSWNTVDNSMFIVREAQEGPRGRTIKLGPDEKRFAVGIDDSIEIWDLETKKLVANLNGFHGQIMSLAIDDRNERLFAGTADGMIEVWNLESKEMLLSFKAHDSMIVSLALSPDNTSVLSSSHRGELKLWESKDIDYPLMQQRAIVEKATAIVNRYSATKQLARGVVSRIANDTSIEDPEILNTAIAIANARSHAPIEPKAYSPTAASKPSTSSRSIPEHLSDASRVFKEQFEKLLGENLVPLREFDEKRLRPGQWHSMANQLVELPVWGVSVDAIAFLLESSLTHPNATHDLAYLKGIAHAKLGQWEQTERCFSIALGHVPRRSGYWHEYAYRLAFLRAYLGKWKAYRELCEQVLIDFGDTQDEQLAERTAKMCLFSKDIHIQIEQAAHLADLAWGNRENSTIIPSTELAVGIADLRRERFTQAAEHFESSAALHTQLANPSGRINTATAKLYLAIAYQRLGRAEDAKQTFKEASTLLDDVSNVSAVWNDWMNAQLVQQEAKATLTSE
jgi:serine/threonine protein kinase/WD40 repeat protein/tetratricopeptide (TPR) repeat protein